MTCLSRYAIVLVGLCTTLLSTSFADTRTTEPAAEWQHEDLQVFRDKFLNVDRSFSPDARAAAEARLAVLEKTSPVDPAHLATELCRIAALADNGHTQCLPNGVGKAVCERFTELVTEDSPWCHLVKPDAEIPDFKNVPVRFRAFGEEFYVTAIGGAHADLLGARLLAVDGKPVASIRETLRTFAGGTIAHRDDVAADVLTSPQRLRAVRIAQGADVVTYTFLVADGKKLERQFSSNGSSKNWLTLPAAQHTPWTLQEPEKPFRFRDAPEIDAVVIQLRQILDSKDEKIADFLESSEQHRTKLGRRNVVLDMRENGGGNFLQARDFMTNWPTRVPGQFYVLTSRQTFSAAITSIAYLKQAGEERVTIVGEPAGDRLMFFSDGLPVQLPHSGLFFLPAVIRMDYADGCRKYDDCFEGIAQPGRPAAVSLLKVPPGLQRIPLSVDSIEPDIAVPETIDAWLHGKDAAMETLVRIAKANTKSR